jgi:hypothetical protein
MPLYTINVAKFSSERPEYLTPFATHATGSAEDKEVSATPSVRTVGSRCSRFRPFTITHFNTNVSTSREWLQWTNTTWLANRLLPPPVIVQIPLSSVTLCRSLSAFDWSVLYGVWFCFYPWSFTLSNVFAVTSILLCYVRFFYVIMTGTAQVLQSKQAFCFKLKRYSVVYRTQISTTSRFLWPNSTTFSLPVQNILCHTSPHLNKLNQNLHDTTETYCTVNRTQYKIERSFASRV